MDNRVFEPFFTAKPVGSGTGLGLAISYGILKAHDGSIEFSSEEGSGTEFTLKIPLSLGADTLSLRCCSIRTRAQDIKGVCTVALGSSELSLLLAPTNEQCEAGFLET